MVESVVEQLACWQQLSFGLQALFRQAIPKSEMTAQARLRCAGLFKTVEETLRFSWHPKALSWNVRVSLHTKPVGTRERQDANTTTGPVVNKAGKKVVSRSRRTLKPQDTREVDAENQKIAGVLAGCRWYRGKLGSSCNAHCNSISSGCKYSKHALLEVTFELNQTLAF